MNCAAQPALIPRAHGRTYCLAGELITIKITSEQTDGHYALIEILTPPGGGTPPHVHHNESEIFTIIEGRFAFHLPGKTVLAEKGAVVFAPANIPHRYENIGATPGTLHVALVPGSLDRFFMEAGDEVPEGATTPLPVTQERIDKLVRTCARYAMEVLPPDQKLGSG